jgi:hypothetical protein
MPSKKEKPMTEIRISVEGGVIQGIDWDGENCRVVIFDYDIDGISDAELGVDCDGNKCVVNIWE